VVSDPGQKISSHIIARIPCASPWPIEYSQRARLRGDWLTLVLHKACNRAGPAVGFRYSEKPPRALLKQLARGGFGCVLYCDLEATLYNEDINPESLAQFAIACVEKSPARNAIRYLAQNIDQGIITPMTYAYRDAILRRTGKESPAEAERIVMCWFRDR